MSAILLTLFVVVLLTLVGVVCAVKGRAFGKEEGKEVGFEIGWRHAHRRVADALRVTGDALNTSLLALELHNDSEPETLIANIRCSHQLPEEISE